MPAEELRRHYPELNNEIFVPIDILDDAQVLGSIANESIDFIIANHLIEHCDNPLGTLANWLLKLRPDGIIFMAVPDQRKGWDERRAVTSLQHMIEDYQATASHRKARNFQHFEEWVQLVGNIHDPAHVQQLIDMDYSIHFHVFTFESFHDLLEYGRKNMSWPITIVEAIEPSEQSWESLFVLRKAPRRAELSDRAPSFWPDPKSGTGYECSSAGCLIGLKLV